MNLKEEGNKKEEEMKKIQQNRHEEQYRLVLQAWSNNFIIGLLFTVIIVIITIGFS